MSFTCEIGCIEAELERNRLAFKKMKYNGKVTLKCSATQNPMVLKTEFY